MDECGSNNRRMIARFGLFFVCIICITLHMTPASAWGSETHRYICEESVREVWGSEILSECFTGDPQSRRELCELIGEIESGNYHQICLAEPEFIHPSLIPHVVFNDTELHYDYTRCPIPEHQVLTRKWICNESGGNPAGRQADFWFQIAGETDSVCRQAYAFCIASNYFSDSYMPLYQVTHALPGSMEEMDARVDKKILDGEIPWKTHVLAVFQQKTRRSVVSFYTSNKDIEEIIDRLVTEGKRIGSTKPLVREETGINETREKNETSDMGDTPGGEEPNYNRSSAAPGQTTEDKTINILSPSPAFLAAGLASILIIFTLISLIRRRAGKKPLEEKTIEQKPCEDKSPAGGKEPKLDDEPEVGLLSHHRDLKELKDELDRIKSTLEEL